MIWEKIAPYKGPIHQGCLNCPPVEEVASPEMLIAVGFGSAHVSKDDEIIYYERPTQDTFPTLAEFEAMAKMDPDHDWRVVLFAPLRDREYQRHGDDRWVLIHMGPGFA